MQVGAIKQIPVPDLTQLAPENLGRASQAFDQLKNRELLPACQAHADETRKVIDEAVLQMFGLVEPDPLQSVPGKQGNRSALSSSVEDLRNEFSSEPQIHGFNQQAEDLLRARQGA